MVRVLLQGVFGKANSVVTTLAAALSVSLQGVPRTKDAAAAPAHAHVTPALLPPGLGVGVITPEVARDACQAQEQVTRYLSLAHALLYKACEGDRDLSDLARAQCATQEEVECLLRSEVSGPDDVYGWISVLIHRLAKAGLLGVSECVLLCRSAV
jgi:hypothetical protein